MVKNNLVVVIIISALTFLAYGNSLNNDFVWDDKVYILESEPIKTWDSFIEVFKSPSEHASEGETVDLSRPLMAFSLFFDYAIWGKNPFGFHLSNVILHLFNSLLVYFVVVAIFGRGLVSIVSAIIFTLHPLHTEAINVITFREDLLASFFYLLSLLAYFSGIKENGRFRWLYLSLMLIFFAAALLSKEMSITLPLVVVLFHWLVVRKDKNTVFPQRSLIGLLFLILATTLIYLHFIYGVYSSLPDSFYSGYPAGSLTNSILTLPLIIIYYVKLLLIPVSMLADYSFPIVTSVSSPLFLVASVLLAGIFFSAKYMGMKARFLLLWFFVSLLPVSNLVPTFNMTAERFLYLPSISFVILLSHIIVEAVDRLEGRTIVKFYFPMSFISILFLLITYSRNNVWMNDRSIWEDTLKKNRLSFIAHSNLGTICRDEGNYEEAIKEYKKAVFLQDKNAKIHFNLGLAYVDLGAYENALGEFVKARNIEPDNIQYIVNLGGINGMMGRHEAAVEVFKDALKIDPANEFAKNNLLIAEKAMSRRAEK